VIFFPSAWRGTHPAFGTGNWGVRNGKCDASNAGGRGRKEELAFAPDPSARREILLYSCGRKSRWRSPFEPESVTYRKKKKRLLFTRGKEKKRTKKGLLVVVRDSLRGKKASYLKGGPPIISADYRPTELLPDTKKKYFVYHTEEKCRTYSFD